MTRTDIACIGAAHMDRIARCWEAFVWRASNPVTVMSSHGGVARNVALNLARLGQRVKLVSVLGEDEEGAAISAELCSAGVDLSDVTRLTGLSTASYTAVLDPTGELMVGLADADIYENLGSAHLKALMPSLAAWPFWVVDANLPEAGIGALVGGRRTVLHCRCLRSRPPRHSVSCPISAISTCCSPTAPRHRRCCASRWRRRPRLWRRERFCVRSGLSRFYYVGR